MTIKTPDIPNNLATHIKTGLFLSFCFAIFAINAGTELFGNSGEYFEGAMFALIFLTLPTNIPFLHLDTLLSNHEINIPEFFIVFIPGLIQYFFVGFFISKLVTHIRYKQKTKVKQK